MNQTQIQRQKKLFLTASIVLNLGLLVYFKYFNFFIDNFNILISSIGVETLSWTKIALPIGISFFTFQSLSYSLDVYRKVHQPLGKVSDYMLYIVMFPQMIAGPIVRFNTVADQITERSSTLDDKLIGFFRFIIGLSKKVLIADVMGEKASEIMGATTESILLMDYSGMSSSMAWIGILAYTFQIYFDFSGYSDMAIGLGRMIGFKFPENFNNPYTAQSITEFWQRWHITLSSWMRDYLYIPLGGNRTKTKVRLYLNLWIVFLISGLWHGSSWGFIFWGFFHGFFLVIERLFLNKILKKSIPLINVIYTFVTVVLGWVVFKLEDFGQSIEYYKRLFAFEFELPKLLFINYEFIGIFCIAALFSFFTLWKPGKKLHDSIFENEYSTLKISISFVLGVVLFLLCLGSITSSTFHPFIYFKF